MRVVGVALFIKFV